MNTIDYQDVIDNIPEEARGALLALSVLMNRIRTLPKDDQNDLYELFEALRDAENDEERVSAQRGMEEILAQKPMTASELPHRSKGDGLTKWAAHAGKRIKQLREKAGLTQSQLAEKAGIPQSYVSRLENGDHSPTHKTVTKLAQALGVLVGEIDPLFD